MRQPQAHRERTHPESIVSISHTALAQHSALRVLLAGHGLCCRLAVCWRRRRSASHCCPSQAGEARMQQCEALAAALSSARSCSSECRACPSCCMHLVCACLVLPLHACRPRHSASSLLPLRFAAFPQLCQTRLATQFVGWNKRRLCSSRTWKQDRQNNTVYCIHSTGGSTILYSCIHPLCSLPQLVQNATSCMHHTCLYDNTRPADDQGQP